MSLATLDDYSRRNSTPVARNGYLIPTEVLKVITYRDEPTLTYFLVKHGARAEDLPEFLRINRIGRASDLQPGTRVKLPRPPSTYVKPENI